MLSLRLLSMLRRMLELLERLLAMRTSSGSWGLRPLARANRFRMSVKLMTPERRPERLAPGMAEADIAGAGAPERWDGVWDATGVGPAEGRGVTGLGGTRMAGVRAGVGGPDEAGEGESTTHMRWDRVATSLATVWARVEYGFTWNTGNESLPSFTPRSERMTDMKWMQEERRRGREVDLVRSWHKNQN